MRQHKGTENKIKVLFVFFFNISSKKENLFNKNMFIGNNDL